MIKTFSKSLLIALGIGTVLGLSARLSLFPILSLLHNRWIKLLSSENVDLIYHWSGQVVGTIAFLIIFTTYLKKHGWKTRGILFSTVFAILILIGLGLGISLLIHRESHSEMNDALNQAWPPLHLAVRNNDISNVEKLLKDGMDINMKNYPAGNMPIHIAAASNNEAMMILLIVSGGNVNAQCDLLESSPLHIAAGDGHANIVEILISNGAIIDSRDIDYQTPLHWASQFGKLNCLKVLINHGSDIEAKDFEGKTPLALAIENGHDDIATLLKESRTKH